MKVRYICQNCDGRWRSAELQTIKRYHERVSDGEKAPAGECPACGALCHAESLMGWSYTLSGSDGPSNRHIVVSDESEYPHCVLVENAGGQRFPVERAMVELVATAPDAVDADE